MRLPVRSIDERGCRNCSAIEGRMLVSIRLSDRRRIGFLLTGGV
jgi:hypothetical protein